MKFNECPYCGAHLDFGEACDCTAREPEASRSAAGRGGEQDGGNITAAGGAVPRLADNAVRVGRGQSLRGA